MTLAIATPDPKYRVIGDDWSFRVQFNQSNGSPLDLTGASVFADVYRASVLAPVAILSLTSGISLTTTAMAGTVDLLVPSAVTSTFKGQDIDLAGSTLSGGNPNYPNRLVPYVVDSLGRKTTAQIVPIGPEDPRSARVIAPSDLDPVTITVGQQGPAGASNSLTAAEVNALIAAALVVGPPGHDGPQGNPGPVGPPALLNAFEQVATQSGAQAFTLSPALVSAGLLAINGLRQSRSAYSATGTTLTLPATLDVVAGDLITFDYS